MRKLLAPAIFIPAQLLLCSVVTLWLPMETGLRIFWAIGLFFLISFWLAVFVHEIGHVLGAVLGKFRILSFVAGPVAIMATYSGNYVVRPNMNLAWSGGMVRATTRDFNRIRQRRTLLVAGGPLLSLVCGFVFLLWFSNTNANWLINIPKGISSENFNLWAIGCLQGVIGVTSLFLFAMSILPFYNGVLPTDGLQLIRLAQGGPKAERDTAFLLISNLLIGRERPRNLPAELIEQSLAVRDISHEQAMAHYYAYIKALDSTDIELAEQHISQIQTLYRRRKVSRLVQGDFAYTIAFHEAIYRTDEKQALIWLNEGNRLSPSITMLKCRANAAVFFLQGQREAGVLWLKQWAPFFRREIDIGGTIAVFEKEQMEKVSKRYIDDIKPILKK
jgi:hypothetical protein